jgi:hypothetical protein
MANSPPCVPKNAMNDPSGAGHGQSAWPSTASSRRSDPSAAIDEIRRRSRDSPMSDGSFCTAAGLARGAVQIVMEASKPTASIERPSAVTWPTR